MKISLSELKLYIEMGLLALKFGTELVKWFIKSYHEVEKLFKKKPQPVMGEQKADEFDKRVSGAIWKKTGKILNRGELRKIRNKTWALENPGKKPKKIFEPVTPIKIHDMIF